MSKTKNKIESLYLPVAPASVGATGLRTGPTKNIPGMRIYRTTEGHWRIRYGGSEGFGSPTLKRMPVDDWAKTGIGTGLLATILEDAVAEMSAVLEAIIVGAPSINEVTVKALSQLTGEWLAADRLLACVNRHNAEVLAATRAGDADAFASACRDLARKAPGLSGRSLREVQQLYREQRINKAQATVFCRAWSLTPGRYTRAYVSGDLIIQDLILATGRPEDKSLTTFHDEATASFKASAGATTEPSMVDAMHLSQLI